MERPNPNSESRVPSPGSRLWNASAPLTAVGIVMIGAFVVALVGLVVDPRVITGVPAWFKPAKFAISTAIYMLTLAWIFTLIPEWSRTRRIVGWMTSVILILEVAIIDIQAWRGTTSHFNIGTPLDGILFAIMGLGILVQTASSVAVAVALWRQHFDDRALGWAVRLGMTITIIGASAGGLMTRPTVAQIADAQVTGRLVVAGAHTVGAPDGGPGMPGIKWSADHGDLRVPHFIGLHALQALPLFALLAKRQRWTDRVRARLVVAGAVSYVALFAILLWQALRGQSLVQPDAATLAVLALWATLTTVGLWMAASRRATTAGRAVVLS